MASAPDVRDLIAEVGKKMRDLEAENAAMRALLHDHLGPHVIASSLVWVQDDGTSGSFQIVRDESAEHDLMVKLRTMSDDFFSYDDRDD